MVSLRGARGRATARAGASDAAQAAITIPLGGLATAAITYLLAERFTREITAAALADGAPEQPVGPGVGARVIVAWGLAAAFPLLGCVLLAVSVLVVGHWSPTRIAISLLILSAVALALGLRATSIAGRSVADPIEAVRAGTAQSPSRKSQRRDPRLRRQRSRAAAGRLQRDDRRPA